MFMPQSQPHQLGRSYGAPGTARRGARDKENAGALPSKTPVRAPLGKAGPSTGRALGARTMDRNILATQQPSEDIGMLTRTEPRSHQRPSACSRTSRARARSRRRLGDRRSRCAPRRQGRIMPSRRLRRVTTCARQGRRCGYTMTRLSLRQLRFRVLSGLAVALARACSRLRRISTMQT